LESGSARVGSHVDLAVLEASSRSVPARQATSNIVAPGSTKVACLEPADVPQRLQGARRGVLCERRDFLGVTLWLLRSDEHLMDPIKAAVNFGPYRFVPATGQLFSGRQEVRLTPKAAAVLAELVAHAGQPVTKEDLYGSVWRDTAVGDDALTSCIKELRRAFGDDPRQPRYIETRHRRGYRFMPEIAEIGGMPPTNASIRSRTEGPANTASAVAIADQDPTMTPGSTGRKPTVAVLPFENVSGDPGQDYFSDGITGDIITALSKHRSILVVARSSTFVFRGHGTDVREVGDKLGADYVVEGSVANISGRLRVSARLVETEGGRHVWADRYDHTVEQVFDVQDQITTTVAARIEPEVSTAERRRVEKRPPPKFSAWDLFNLGQTHVYLSTTDDNIEAQRLFRCAIDLDPTLAAAYAWLSYAIVLGMLYFDVEPDEVRLNEAVTLARRGVELDDQDALTHFGYGRALLARKAYDHALSELQSALELNPHLAIVYCGLGDSLAYEGRFGDAIPFFEKAISLSPYDPQRWAFYSYRALAHLLAGQFDAALAWSTKATRIPNCHYWPFAHRVSALGHLEDLESVTLARSELLQRQPKFSCAFAERRLFYIKNPAHIERYLKGLRKAGFSH
jgi:TolB-like protein/DNA-binding SARP family transcriptional activator